MLRKLLMGSKKKMKYYVTIKQEPYESGITWKVSSPIYPDNELYENIMCSQAPHGLQGTKPDGYDYQTALNLKKESAAESVIITRLDNDQSLNLVNANYPETTPGFLVKAHNTPSSALFTQSDNGKTIDITIELMGGG